MYKRKATFKNPVVEGFYPDPSICRVGEDYYMVHSSFSYFPGLPVLHSRDLVHWRQIGHAVDRVDQLEYRNSEAKFGLWAPTIRHHKGVFYIVNTMVYRDGAGKMRMENFVLTAQNPAGPWSDPVVIEGAGGIDPSLFFDDDGSLWYTGNQDAEDPWFEGQQYIYLQKLDPDTFQLDGERHFIWDAGKVGGAWVEAPHIYKHNGVYYLMIAEGGTYDNHGVMMAKSPSLEQPDFRVCPRNPILTHRHLPLDRDISVVGHGDLFQTQNGEWWMTVLGLRPYEGFYHSTGRETFLVPMYWDEDGWPRVDTPDGLVQAEERLPDLPPAYLPREGAADSFEAQELGFAWNTIHPPVEPFYSLTENQGHLRLYTRPGRVDEISTPAFVGRRQCHKAFLLQAAMDFTPEAEYEQAGLAVVHDETHGYTLLRGASGGKAALALSVANGGGTSELASAEVEAGRRLYLTVQCDVVGYSFYYGYHEGERIPLLEGADARILSSTVTLGFTGVYLGMYATSNGEAPKGHADFDWCFYTGFEE